MSPPGLCYGGGVLPDTPYGALGGNVIFATTLAPTSTPATLILWKVNGSNIITVINGIYKELPAYQGRVTLDNFSGAQESSLE